MFHLRPKIFFYLRGRSKTRIKEDSVSEFLTFKLLGTFVDFDWIDGKKKNVFIFFEIENGFSFF